ncbi:MAG: hypothetical protein KDD25_00330 [Bdellovibrionales bacterium]|nr:hypothetical protein [Bdellovibrionales bacterium]
MRIHLFILFITFIFTASCQTTNGSFDCIQRRAAFDIGSESTRIKVADVDTCHFKIVKVILDESRKVSYKNDISNSPKKKFSEQIKVSGINALTELKLMADKLDPKPIEYVGLATSAWRDAINSEEFAERVRKETKISIHVITQKLEAKMGYLGALATTQNASAGAVVWDIGGGSQQIITKSDDDFVVFESQMASVDFKNLVIKNVKMKDPKRVSTPNPISPTQAGKAKALAKGVVKDAPEEIRKAIKENPEQIYGIGGVHYYSIRGQTKTQTEYSSDDVQKAVQAQSGKSDQQVGGEYASTDVTNLILVQGMMEALGISKVKLAKVNMTDGALVYSAIWH